MSAAIFREGKEAAWDGFRFNRLDSVNIICPAKSPYFDSKVGHQGCLLKVLHFTIS